MAENGSPRASALASVAAVVGVLAAVGLMLLLVTWAATIGPQQVLRDEGNPPTYPSLDTDGVHLRGTHRTGRQGDRQRR